ncbi:hypothetical protein NMG60_11014000 [Bertholletia excelsa]
MAEPSNRTRPVCFPFNSPKFLTGFLKNPPETETTSPTSVLDSEPFSTKIFPRNKHLWENVDLVGICLALDNENRENNFPQKVLLGSKQKIQIPLLPYSVSSPNSSPRTDYGIKNWTSRSTGCSKPVRAFPESLSASEMELSEDYTCVIYHGPNSKTTHIYDDCVLRTEYCPSPEKLVSPAQERLLGFCHTCRKDLEDGDDIYTYRGEKSFRSCECRCQEMLSP